MYIRYLHSFFTFGFPDNLFCKCWTSIKKNKIYCTVLEQAKTLAIS